MSRSGLSANAHAHQASTIKDSVPVSTTECRTHPPDAPRVSHLIAFSVRGVPAARYSIAQRSLSHPPDSRGTSDAMCCAVSDPQKPMYRLFTDDEHVKKPNIPTGAIRSRAANSKQDSELRTFAKFFSRMGDKHRGLLFHMAAKMARRA